MCQGRPKTHGYLVPFLTFLSKGATNHYPRLKTTVDHFYPPLVVIGLEDKALKRCLAVFLGWSVGHYKFLFPVPDWFLSARHCKELPVPDLFQTSQIL